MKCNKCNHENNPFLQYCSQCGEKFENDMTDKVKNVTDAIYKDIHDILNEKPEASFEFVIENPDPELIQFIMGGTPAKEVDNTVDHLHFTPEEHKQALLGMIDAGFTAEEAYNELKETYKF